MKFVVLAALLLAGAAPLCAQSPAEQLAIQFTKKKDQTKHKKGVTIRKFHEVRAEPWEVTHVQVYAGSYDSDIMKLHIDVSGSGDVVGSGSDPRSFRLRNARIVDGFLTGTKVYESGRTEPFEAAFLKRYDVVEPGGSEMMLKGIGMIIDAPPGHGMTGPMKVFMVRR